MIDLYSEESKAFGGPFRSQRERATRLPMGHPGGGTHVPAPWPDDTRRLQHRVASPYDHRAGGRRAASHSTGGCPGGGCGSAPKGCGSCLGAMNAPRRTDPQAVEVGASAKVDPFTVIALGALAVGALFVVGR